MSDRQLGPPTPVHIYQWEDEFTELLSLYRERQPKRILEIGSAQGGSLYHWLQNATTGSLVVSVDDHAVFDSRCAYESWTRPGITLVAIEGDSTSAPVIDRVHEYAPFDWIFIDGGHSHEVVESDWLNYGSMSASPATLVLHDIAPCTLEEIEVLPLWEKVRRAESTREIVVDESEFMGGYGIVDR